MTQPTPSAPPDRSTAPKSTLHCPVCGHESPAEGGDWRIAHGEDTDAANTESSHEHVTYTCPECDTVVTTRARRRAIAA